MLNELEIEILHELTRNFKGFGDEGTPVKQSMKLWRVEMKNGNGPYNSKLPESSEIYWKLCSSRPNGFDCARLAHENGEQAGVSDYAFFLAHGDASYACDSLDALHRWFPEDAREYLKGLGAQLVEYLVPTGQPVLQMGNGEVIFNKTTAIALSRTELD